MAVGGNVQAGVVQSINIGEFAGDGLGGRRVDITSLDNASCDFNANGNAGTLLVRPDGSLKLTASYDGKLITVDVNALNQAVVTQDANTLLDETV